MTLATRSLQAGGREVPLLAGPGALAELPRALAAAGFEGRLFVIADEYALALHGAVLDRALSAPNLTSTKGRKGEKMLREVPSVATLAISGLEEHKTLESVSRVWDWLIDRGAQRRDALLAFGGGVVCDLAGFAAASYLRGVGLVNVPTTLLAQVDASVGGKTGVNHARGKNLIGAFYQPLCVVADTSLLATLSPRAFAGGMAEVAKIGMILDADLFARLESVAPGLTTGDADTLAPLVARSIELKAGIVERDERESGDRMLLNYGHTIGHALEAGAGYGGLLHGEAVSIGMQAAASIAEGMGMLGAADAGRQAALLEELHLPLRWHASPDEILGRLSVDKKRAGDRQRWVLAERIGAGRVRDDVPSDVVLKAVTSIASR